MRAPDSSSRTSLLLGSLLIIGVWLVEAGPLLTAGAADMRMLGVFQADEIMHVNMLRGALVDRTMKLIFGSYGHLYFNLALVPLHIWTSVVSLPADLQILLVLRTIAFIFGLATALIVFYWAAADVGMVAAVVAALLVLTSPLLTLWSELSHPDTAQLFFITLSLYWARRMGSGVITRIEIDDDPALHFDSRNDSRPLLLASMAAGFAFASKYSGLFVLPVIAVIAARSARRLESSEAARVIRVARIVSVVVGCAAVVVAIAAAPPRVVALLAEDGRADIPGAVGVVARVRYLAIATGCALVAIGAASVVWRRVAAWPRLIDWMRSMTIVAASFTAAFVCASPYSLRKLAFLKGLYFEGTRLGAASMSQAAVEWSRVSLDALGPLLLLAVPVAWAIARRERGRTTATDTVRVLLLFVVMYAVVLVTRVRLTAAHYALPLLPACALLAGYSAQRLAERLPARRVAAAAIVAMIAIVTVPRYADARARYLHREETTPAVLGGRWLQCAVSPGARVTYDYLSYVPPVFVDSYPTWGGTPQWRDEMAPDVIVVHQAIARENLDRPGNREYYACLASAACGFDRWFANQDVQVYGRRDRAGAIRTGAACDESGAAP